MSELCWVWSQWSYQGLGERHLRSGSAGQRQRQGFLRVLENLRFAYLEFKHESGGSATILFPWGVILLKGGCNWARHAHCALQGSRMRSMVSLFARTLCWSGSFRAQPPMGFLCWKAFQTSWFVWGIREEVWWLNFVKVLWHTLRGNCAELKCHNH